MVLAYPPSYHCIAIIQRLLPWKSFKLLLIPELSLGEYGKLGASDVLVW